MSNLRKKILFLSPAYSGSSHDYSMLKEEFTPCKRHAWFSGREVYVDLGFLGIRKDYEPAIHIPNKRSKSQPELSELQKEENRKMSGVRIVVEHAIGGMKRFRILSDRLRMRSIVRYNQIAGICAGIWNFCLSN